MVLGVVGVGGTRAPKAESWLADPGGSLGWRLQAGAHVLGQWAWARLPCLLPPTVRGRPPTPTPHGAFELKSLNFFF